MTKTFINEDNETICEPCSISQQQCCIEMLDVRPAEPDDICENCKEPIIRFKGSVTGRLRYSEPVIASLPRKESPFTTCPTKYKLDYVKLEHRVMNNLIEEEIL